MEGPLREVGPASTPSPTCTGMIWSTEPPTSATSPLCPECVPESGGSRRRITFKAAEVGEYLRVV